MLQMVFSQILTSCRSYHKRIREADKLYVDKLDFEDIKFIVKVRDIQKNERKNSISINDFGYDHKKKNPI